MAKGYKVYKPCQACCGKGTRTIYSTSSPSEVTCEVCGGDGIVFDGWCTELLYDMPELTADPTNQSGD